MKGRKWIAFVLALAVAIVGIWLWWANYGVQLMYRVITASATEVAPAETLIAQLGQTGDVFGGVNALFAALAFLGVAVAAYFQYLTLELVQERHHIEVFEPLFFKLLDASTSMPMVNYFAPHESSSASLGPFIRGAIVKNTSIAPTLASLTREQARAKVTNTWRPYKELNDDNLGPYLRGLFHVFDFIDRAELTQEQKVKYANIARGSLTSDRLRLLMLNCCTIEGGGFRELAERYGLFKYLPRQSYGMHDPTAELCAQIMTACFEQTAWLGFKQRTAYLRTAGMQPESGQLQ